MFMLPNHKNQLFTLVRQGKRVTPVWLAILLAVLFVFIGQFIGAIPYAILLILEMLPSGSSPMGAALFLVIFFFITLTPTGLLLWLWLALYEKRPLRTLGLERTGALPKFLRGLLLGGLIFLGVVLLLALPGMLEVEDGFAGITLTAFLALLIALPGWILQGSLEEVLMRGWLMPVVGVRAKPWMGVLISSGLFAVLHLLNPNVTLLSVVNLVLAGLMFALFALWEEGLWGVCGLHAAWNWVQGGLGFPVSGNLLNSPVLLPLAETGPDVLTGGAFGPEGGLGVTAVTLGACIVLAWLIYRKREIPNAANEPNDSNS